jgi:NAD+ diphosphatase
VTFESMVAPPAPADGDAVWLCVRDGDVLVAGDQLPRGPVPPVPVTATHFLGLLDGRHCWSADAGREAAAPPGHAFVELRALYGRVTEGLWSLAGRAVQIVEWDRTHRFCGRCATATVAVDGERARRCPACGLLAFPRLAPAVIVLIEREGEVLLARGRAFPIPMYSCLAGFVEPGETLEEAVHREVLEEVGVTLSSVTYFGSQPWPFPHSLMIGFTARWAGGDIRVQEAELVDARWWRAGDLPMIPPPMSIARRLIDAWLARGGSFPDHGT